MKVTTVDKPLDEISADALALILFKGEKPEGAIADLDKKISGSISEVIRLKEFKGKLYETTSIFTHGKIPAIRVLLVGAGKKSDFTPRVARNLAGTATRAAQKIGAKNLAFYLEKPETAEEVIEGVILGTFDPGLYKSKKENTVLTELFIAGPVDKEIIKHSVSVSVAVNRTRELVQEPPNRLTPEKMMQEAKKIASEYKFDIEIIDEKEATKKGMGAFVGVAKGSEEPSYLVVLKYKGGGKETLGIVGKGITFDTGGISLKSANKMKDMKADMAGAAACFGVMRVVGELRPKINVVMVCPLTENMPSGKALKPDDVIVAFNGKSIEITNTDAEGRLVLADALGYAEKLGAKKIVDLATLTGAVLVVFGNEATAIMGTPQTWVNTVVKASESAGERFWQLPMYPEYKRVLKSDIADVANAYKSHPEAGTIAGAIFLQEFVDEKTDWVHLDIAGTAWLDGETPFLTKGPTGVGVRTLVKLIESLEKGK